MITATVSALPVCDICHVTTATYDAKLKGHSAWAYQCESCFEENGQGLGMGVGQKLILEGEGK
jgi:hypothetical protein